MITAALQTIGLTARARWDL